MNSSLEEDYSAPVEALGLNVQLDINEVSDTCFINGGFSADSMLDTEDEKLLSDEQCHNSGLQVEELDFGLLNSEEYLEKIEQFQVYLEKVKKIVRPGCSQELLNMALSSLSSLASTLSVMSSKPKLNASL